MPNRGSAAHISDAQIPTSICSTAGRHSSTGAGATASHTHAPILLVLRLLLRVPCRDSAPLGFSPLGRAVGASPLQPSSPRALQEDRATSKHTGAAGT